MPNDKETFKKLIGDSMVFFNKDANQNEAFKSRPRAINHIADCQCNECKRIRNAEAARISLDMLKGLGAF